MSLPVHRYPFSAPSIHIHPSSVALILHRVIGILEPMPGDSGYKVSWTRCQQCMLIEDDWGGNPRNTARTRKKKLWSSGGARKTCSPLRHCTLSYVCLYSDLNLKWVWCKQEGFWVFPSSYSVIMRTRNKPQICRNSST